MTDDNTTDLRQRLLLWHRVLAQMTGTLSLSYGGKGLKKSALDEWATRLETVATDMRSISGPENSRLDMSTREVLRSAARTAPMGDVDSGQDGPFFGKRGGSDELPSEQVVHANRPETVKHRTKDPKQEPHHDLEVLKPSPRGEKGNNSTPPGQASKGPKKATRRAPLQT